MLTCQLQMPFGIHHSFFSDMLNGQVQYDIVPSGLSRSDKSLMAHVISIMGIGGGKHHGLLPLGSI